MLGWTLPLAAPYPTLTTDLILCLQLVFIFLFFFSFSRCLCVALYVVSMSCVCCVRDFISGVLALELNRGGLSQWFVGQHAQNNFS